MKQKLNKNPKRNLRGLTARALVLGSAIALFTCLGAIQGQTNEYPRFIRVVGTTNTPIGWVQFCDTYATECTTKRADPRDVVLDDKSWNYLIRVNKWANDNIKPMTDMDHYGMIQWWRYPDDGAGACHSYALLKRRMLLEAGWPRTALLMTIVHEKNGEGHAVLTVKTDRGEFILDNLSEKILPWSETPYSYYKRQSQADPNVWVALDDPRDVAAATVTSNVR
jgi:predicted transglutaminase-like cysteine proteinase